MYFILMAHAAKLVLVSSGTDTLPAAAAVAAAVPPTPAVTMAPLASAAPRGIVFVIRL
jgi:hypothetical protein